jgi:hypothetical protein
MSRWIPLSAEKKITKLLFEKLYQSAFPLKLYMRYVVLLCSANFGYDFSLLVPETKWNNNFMIFTLWLLLNMTIFFQGLSSLCVFASLCIFLFLSFAHFFPFRVFIIFLFSNANSLYIIILATFFLYIVHCTDLNSHDFVYYMMHI